MSHGDCDPVGGRPRDPPTPLTEARETHRRGARRAPSRPQRLVPSRVPVARSPEGLTAPLRVQAEPLRGRLRRAWTWSL